MRQRRMNATGGRNCPSNAEHSHCDVRRGRLNFNDKKLNSYASAMNPTPILFANSARIAHSCASMHGFAMCGPGSAGIDRAVERYLK